MTSERLCESERTRKVYNWLYYLSPEELEREFVEGGFPLRHSIQTSPEPRTIEIRLNMRLSPRGHSPAQNNAFTQNIRITINEIE